MIMATLVDSAHGRDVSNRMYDPFDGRPEKHPESVETMEQYDSQDEQEEQDGDDATAEGSEGSYDSTEEQEEEIDPQVLEDMIKFEESFQGISKRFRIINRIGEGKRQRKRQTV
jgi:hypothetical protein